MTTGQCSEFSFRFQIWQNKIAMLYKAPLSSIYITRPSSNFLTYLQIMTNLESMKRYWKRKQYQRIDNTNSKRKLRIARLLNRRQRVANVNETANVMLKLISPLKFLSKFQNGMIFKFVEQQWYEAFAR